MKKSMVAIMFLVFALGLIGCTAEQNSLRCDSKYHQRDSLRVMKISDVIALSQAGVSDSLIISTMDATDSRFQLRTRDVLDLKNAGVSEKVIKAMMQEPSAQSKEARDMKYYVYTPYYWYSDFYPYRWYYPSFSVRLGYRSHYPYHFRHGRIR